MRKTYIFETFFFTWEWEYWQRCDSLGKPSNFQTLYFSEHFFQSCWTCFLDHAEYSSLLLCIFLLFFSYLKMTLDSYLKTPYIYMLAANLAENKRGSPEDKWRSLIHKWIRVKLAGVLEMRYSSCF